jgi:hypothetical protein
LVATLSDYLKNISGAVVPFFQIQSVKRISENAVRAEYPGINPCEL